MRVIDFGYGLVSGYGRFGAPTAGLPADWDEAGYLRLNPTVATAIRSGNMYSWTDTPGGAHYLEYGRSGGLQYRTAAGGGGESGFSTQPSVYQGEPLQVVAASGISPLAIAAGVVAVGGLALLLLKR